MSVAASIRDMMAAGFTLEQALTAVEIMEANAPAQSEAHRTARQERNRRYYVSKRLKASYSDGSDANSDGEPSLKDVVPNLVTVQVNQNPSPPIVPPSRKKSAAETISAFDGVLSADRARAVVEHRLKLRKPMTPHAAGLLAKSLSQAPDPNAAADEMIERGWLGWKPDWGQGGRGPPHRQAKRNTALEGLDQLEDRFRNGQFQPPLRIAG